MKKVTFLLAALVLSACSSMSTPTDYENVTFYKNLPGHISSVWTNGRDTYIVPKKYTSIQSLKTNDGQSLDLLSEGSYFKVSGVHDQFFIVVNDQSNLISKN